MTCPNGATSSRWAEDRSQEGAAVVRARFPTAACRPCKSREQCTRSDSRWDMGRRITLRPQAEYEAIQQARAQDTQEWGEQYAHELPPAQRLVDRGPKGPHPHVPSGSPAAC
ncbi:transposase [Streptomyces sp. NPDC003015]